VDALGGEERLPAPRHAPRRRDEERERTEQVSGVAGRDEVRGLADVDSPQEISEDSSADEDLEGNAEMLVPMFSCARARW
jgi:hypothetical protein